VRSWVPVPGTTTGRLVVAALELFGAHGFDAVAVGRIAKQAGVTTGALYHHFGSKAGLYRIVRADVEQRVVDRLEGAASMRMVQTVPDLAPVLLVGFDYLVGNGFGCLLAEPVPEESDGPASPDVIERLIVRLAPTSTPLLAALVTAAWREALRQASNGPDSQHEARAALERLLTGT
jgi:AcrR family transcriptional regulator